MWYVQDESMVEIKCIDPSPNGKVSHVPQSPEEEKYRLIYSKSKVYVHPTAYSRDNIPGFVALVKRVRISRLSSINTTHYHGIFRKQSIRSTY